MGCTCVQVCLCTCVLMRLCGSCACGSYVPNYDVRKNGAWQHVACVHAHPLVCPSVCPCVPPCVRLCTCASVRPSVRSSVCPSIPSVCPSMHVCLRAVPRCATVRIGAVLRAAAALVNQHVLGRHLISRWCQRQHNHRVRPLDPVAA